MGRVADQYAHEQIPVAESVALFERAAIELQESDDRDLQVAGEVADAIASEYASTSALPPETANALRAIIATDAGTIVAEAQAILGPADNYGGRISFRYVVPLCGVLMLIFGVMYMRDKAAGGYKVTSIEAEA